MFSFLRNTSKFLLKLTRYVLLLLLLIALLGFVLPYIHDINRFHYMNYILQFNEKATGIIRTYVPVQIGTINLTQYILVFIIIAFISICNRFIEKLSDWGDVLDLNLARNEFRQLNMGSEGEKQLVILDKKIEEIQSALPKNREKLMKEFVEIKMKLDNMRRELAFLSIDVVNSTQMKTNEDPIVVAHDFLEYRHFIENILKLHECIKSTWTPDGVMICFDTTQAAFNAAKAVLEGLSQFNNQVKTIKADFSVRCGINAGYLLFDNETPLEEISDQVIDIAGHMQKYAKPNTIFMSKKISDSLEMPTYFTAAEIQVDGLDVSFWRLP